VGRLAELGWDRNVLGALGAMAIGNVAIYLVGVPWLMAATNHDLGWAVANGLVNYIPGDVIKLILAAAAFPVAWWVVGRRAGEG
jgi:biotin transport system substrate-specific component